MCTVWNQCNTNSTSMVLHFEAHPILITGPSFCLTFLPVASMPGPIAVGLSKHLYLPAPEYGITIAKCQYIEDLIDCKLSRTRPRSCTSTYLNKGSQYFYRFKAKDTQNLSQYGRSSSLLSADNKENGSTEGSWHWM